MLYEYLYDTDINYQQGNNWTSSLYGGISTREDGDQHLPSLNRRSQHPTHKIYGEENPLLDPIHTDSLVILRGEYKVLLFILKKKKVLGNA